MCTEAAIPSPVRCKAGCLRNARSIRVHETLVVAAIVGLCDSSNGRSRKILVSVEGEQCIQAATRTDMDP